MVDRFKRAAAVLALTASFSMAATPALGAELAAPRTINTAKSFEPARDLAWSADDVAQDRGWGGWGGRRRHHNRVDAGDILAGVLIIGGIAAIASAAGKSNRTRQQQDERARDYQYDKNTPSAEYTTDDRPSWDDSRSSEARGLDSAADRCATEIERGERRIETIDAVNREADGWRVQGRLGGGDAFSCTVDRDGRIRSATVNGAAF